MSFVKQNLTLSWPIEDIEEGDLLTRDYLQSVRPPSGIEGSDMLAVNLITSLQSIGLLRPELFSKASEYAEDSPVKRVLNDSLTRMLKPLFDATPDVRAKSSTISAADSFNVSDFKDTSSAVSEVPIALRRQIVLPAWQGRLDKLKAIRETGQPLKIYMDKVVYLWGQLQGASASRISESDPSTKCPIILVDTPEEADVLYLIDHTYV